MSSPLFIETIKVKDGVLYNLQLHRERLQKTASTFYGKAPHFELSEDQIPEHLRQGLVKCRVIYNDEIISVEFEKYSFKQINSLAVVQTLDIDYTYKYLDRTFLNELYEKRGDASDIMIVKNGLVTDASYANLVFKNNCGLFTPKTCLLKGIKRRTLLDKGIIQEKEIKVSDISAYSEVYLINAMIDLEDQVGTSRIIIS